MSTKVNELVKVENIDTSIDHDFESARTNIHDMIAATPRERYRE